MAKVSITCSHCFATLKLASSEKLGKKVKCPKCGETFLAEADENLDDFSDDLEEYQPPARKTAGRKSVGKPAARAVAKGRSTKTGQSTSGNAPALIAGGAAFAVVLLIGLGVYFSGLFSSSPAPAIAAAPVAVPPAVAAPVVPAMSTNDKLLGLRWFPAETDVLIHVKPSAIWQSSLVSSLVSQFAGPDAEATFQKQIGLKPSEVENVTLALIDTSGALTRAAGKSTTAGGSPLAAFSSPEIFGNVSPEDRRSLAVIRTIKPVNFIELQNVIPKSEVQEHVGKKFLAIKADDGLSVLGGGFSIDPQTIVVGSLGELKRAMEVGETSKPREEWQTINAMPHLVIAVVAPPSSTPGASLPAQISSPPSTPAPQSESVPSQLPQAPFGLRSGSLGLTFQGGVDLEVAVNGDDPQSLAQLKGLIESQIPTLKAFIEPGKSTMPEGLGALAKQLVERLKIEQTGGSLRVATSLPDTAQQQLVAAPMQIMLLAMTGGPQLIAEPAPAVPDGTSTYTSESIWVKMPKKVPVEISGLGHELEISACTVRSRWSATDAETQTEYIPKGVLFCFEGKDIGEVVGVGKFSISNLSTDQGDLKFSELDSVNGNEFKFFLPVSRQEEDSHNPDLNTFKLQFDRANIVSRRITRLEGQLTYLTAKKRVTHSIKNASKRLGKPFSEQKLKSLGLEMWMDSREFADEQLEYLKISTDPSVFVAKAEIEYVGKKDYLGRTPRMSSWPDVKDGRQWFGFSGFEDGLRLRGDETIHLETYSDIAENVVTFRFEDFPMP
ncbi:MAG: hypothetical protein C0478_13950 [Planctomyces sp.]|nr:hypothetical protein [Planctomyces sp.]